MQTTSSNAFKVGVAIVIAIAIFIFGIRFFEDIPLQGTYTLETEFEHVDGLIPGNIVQINGVRVGSVSAVELNNDTRHVHIWLRINRGVMVPSDSHTELTGFSAFGGVQVEIALGQADTYLQDGDALPSIDVSLLTHASEFAKPYVTQIDSVLNGLNGALAALENQLDEPTSDVRQMLSSLNNLTGSLDQVVRSERSRLTSILANLDSTISSANSLTVTGRDSLAQTMHALQNTLSHTDTTLMGLQELTTNLNSLLTKIDSGQGTLGLLANNPSLYHNMDSTFASLNRLLSDFQKDPNRYLRHIKPVDIF